MSRMYNIDKKQIKRMTVEVTDAGQGKDARILIRLWNATGSPLRDDVPVEVLFYDMDIAAPIAGTVTMFNGTKRTERGNSAGVVITNNTELVLTPNEDTGVVEFTLGQDEATYNFFVQCGNATYAGHIYTGNPR